MSIIQELKRRNVIRVAVLYAVAGWVVLQIADVLFEQLGIPAWGFRLVLGLLILGFPLALIFSWVFEITPEGVKRTGEMTAGETSVPVASRRMNLLIVILLLVAIGGMIADRLIPERITPASTQEVAGLNAEAGDIAPAQKYPVPEDEKTIAVLPFVNISGDPDNEYFSDGLSEELLNALVRNGGLKVTGRTSAFAFKGVTRDLREIGDILNVANVLEGSVRKAGNRVRITAQLVKTSDGFHLWSDTFDRELDDIFTVQQEIADQVTRALHTALLGTPAVITSRNAKAYEEYLRGLYIWQRNPDELEPLDRAQAQFENALAIDSEYVDAFWGMFIVWDRKNRNGWGPFLESIDRMQQYVNELERLAPESDRTLSAKGRLAVVNFEYQKARSYLGAAARQYPASVEVLGNYAAILAHISEYEEAIDVINKAGELDPLSLDIMRWKSFINYKAGNCEVVEQILSRALEIEPGVGRFHYYAALCEFETGGDIAHAITLAEAEPLAWAHQSALAIMYHAIGDAGKAKETFDTMFEENGEAASYQYGQVYAQWGDREKALEWLEHAVIIRDPGLLQANDDRLLAPLLDEPRFQQILRQAGHR
jgi:TolB-like protein/Tfp pilus assembly protein PilF